MESNRLNPLLTKKALNKATTYKTPNDAYKLLYGDEPLISSYPKEPTDSAKNPAANPKSLAADLSTSQELFKKQLNILLQQLNDWKLGQNKYDKQIEYFKNILFKPGYATHQSSHYFETIKANLEKILLLLNNENILEHKRIITYKALCQEFEECASGVFGHIENALNNLRTSYSLNDWLAEYRTELMNTYAHHVHLQLYPDDKDYRQKGYQIHTINGFIRYAESKGWNPTKDIDYKDNFIFGMSDEEFSGLLSCLETEYEPSKIVDYLGNRLLMMIQEKIAMTNPLVTADKWVEVGENYLSLIEWLTSLITELFKPKEFDVHKLIETNPQRGDPPKTYIKLELNHDYLYQLAINRMLDDELINRKVYDEKTISLGNRKFLLNHYFPYPVSSSEHPNSYAHWTALPDEDLKNLVTYAITEFPRMAPNIKTRLDEKISEKKEIRFYKNGETTLTKQIKLTEHYPNQELLRNYSSFVQALMHHTAKMGKNRSLEVFANAKPKIKPFLIKIKDEIQKAAKNEENIHILQTALGINDIKAISSDLTNRVFHQEFYYDEKSFSKPSNDQYANWDYLSDEETTLLYWSLAINRDTEVRTKNQTFLLTYFLFHVIASDKIKTFSLLIATLANPVIPRADFLEYLSYACEKGAQSIVYKLLNEFKHEVKETTQPLLNAVKGNHANSVRLLIKAGVRIDTVFGPEGKIIFPKQTDDITQLQGETFFSIAAKHNAPDVMEELLSALQKNDTMTPENKKALLNLHREGLLSETAMKHSVMADSPKMVKLLFKNGADVNLPANRANNEDKKRSSLPPAYFAAHDKKNQALQALIDCKADLHYLVGEKQATLSLVAVDSNNASGLRLLINAGITKSNNEGCSLLYHCLKNASSCLTVVIDCKLDVDTPTILGGITPAQYSLASNDFMLLARIIKQGVRAADVIDRMLKLPAEQPDQQSSAKSILPFMNVNERNEHNQLIIHRLANIPFFVTLLLQNPHFKKVINTTDDKGKTFLHSIIESKMPHAFDTFIELIKAGADITQLDAEGNSPLQLAIICGNNDVVRKLLKYDNVTSTLDKKNKAEKTALELAKGNESVTRLLKKRSLMARAYCYSSLNSKQSKLDQLLNKTFTYLIEMCVSHRNLDRFSSSLVENTFRNKQGFDIDSQGDWLLDMPFEEEEKNRKPQSKLLISFLEERYTPTFIINFFVSLVDEILNEPLSWAHRQKKLAGWFNELNMEVDINKVCFFDDDQKEQRDRNYLQNQFLNFLCKERVFNETYIVKNTATNNGKVYFEQDYNEDSEQWEVLRASYAVELLDNSLQNKSGLFDHNKSDIPFFSEFTHYEQLDWLRAADLQGRTQILECLVKAARDSDLEKEFVNTRKELGDLVNEKLDPEQKALAQQLKIKTIDNIKNRTFYLDCYLNLSYCADHWQALSDHDTALLLCILQRRGDFHANKHYLDLIKFLIHDCIASDKVKALTFLLPIYIIPIEELLEKAIISGSKKIIKKCLKMKSTIKKTINNEIYSSSNPEKKTTLLQLAGEKNQHEIIPLLLAAGADIDILNECYTMYDMAALRKNKDNKNPVESKMVKTKCLIATSDYIIKQNQIASLKTLIDAGLLIKIGNPLGTVFLKAIRFSSHDCLSLLLEHRGDIDINEKFGSGADTLIIHAIQNNNIPAAKLLLKAGCDPLNAKNYLEMMMKHSVKQELGSTSEGASRPLSSRGLVAAPNPDHRAGNRSLSDNSNAFDRIYDELFRPTPIIPSVLPLIPGSFPIIHDSSLPAIPGSLTPNPVSSLTSALGFFPAIPQLGQDKPLIPWSGFNDQPDELARHDTSTSYKLSEQQTNSKQALISKKAHKNLSFFDRPITPIHPPTLTLKQPDQKTQPTPVFTSSKVTS